MPKIIVKSGYLESFTHVTNILGYSGNKVDKQIIHFSDGTSLEHNNTNINMKKHSDIKFIKVLTKDGEAFELDPQKYAEKITTSKGTVTIQKLKTNSQEIKREMKDMDFNAYLGYIEGRRGVEKTNGMGLFDLSGDISIEEAKELGLKHKDSIFWSHIISLPEVDNRGYTSRKAWADFIRSIAPDIAKAYNISLNNLVINGAYHANTDNPHVHLIFYSKDKTEGFIKGGTEALNKATEKLKSKFVNGIFSGDIDEIKSILGFSKTLMRDELIDIPNRQIEQATKEKILLLSEKLNSITDGKIKYGYLPKEIKFLVNDILKDIMTNNLSESFEKYLAANSKYISMYIDDTATASARLNKIKSDFFVPSKGKSAFYHNIIIDMAKNLKVNFDVFEQATKEKIMLPVMDKNEDTILKELFNKHENEIQTFNQEIYSNIIKIIYAKKRDEKLYNLITQGGSPEEIFENLCLSNKNIIDDYNNVLNNMILSSDNLDGSKVNDVLLKSSYRGVYANIEYIQSNINDVVKYKNDQAIKSASLDAMYVLSLALNDENENLNNIAAENENKQNKQNNKLLKRKSNENERVNYG